MNISCVKESYDCFGETEVQESSQRKVAFSRYLLKSSIIVIIEFAIA